MSAAVPAASSEARELLVQLRFRRSWAHLDAIRELGCSFCRGALGREAAERAGVVIHELLELAIGAAREGAAGDIELRLEHRGDGFVCEVTSDSPAERLHATRAALAALEPEVERAYRSALRSVSSDSEGLLRLALARIRYEGRAELSFEPLGDDRARLIAVGAG